MYLPEELHRFLAREADARGTSMAEIAREAIGEYRARLAVERRPSVEALVGVVVDDDAATDLAERVDEVLAGHVADDAAWERETGLGTD